MTAIVGPAVLPPTPGLSEARRRLFETALTLFADRGYHAVSVRDLANVLGQQPGAIYAHVASKEVLLYELCSIGLTEHRNRIQTAMLEAGRDPVDQMRAFVYAHVHVHLEYPALARVVTKEFRSLTDAHYDETLRRRQDMEHLCGEIVGRGVASGAFTVKQPLLAIHAIGAMGVRAPEWFEPGSTPTAETVAETYTHFALQILTS